MTSNRQKLSQTFNCPNQTRKQGQKPEEESNRASVTKTNGHHYENLTWTSIRLKMIENNLDYTD